MGVCEDAHDACDLTCLTRLGLSPDLDVAVAVNCFNHAICVSLNNFFRYISFYIFTIKVEIIRISTTIHQVASQNNRM